MKNITILGNIKKLSEFNFLKLTTEDEIKIDIEERKDVIIKTIKDKNYPIEYLDYYKSELKKLIDFTILSDLLQHNSEVVFICKNIKEHIDDNYYRKDFHFLNVLLKGSGYLILRWKDKSGKINLLNIKINEGDVFLFDPTTEHSFICNNDDFCFIYNLSVSVNKKE